jgi:hypothetical protein
MRRQLPIAAVKASIREELLHVGASSTALKSG